MPRHTDTEIIQLAEELIRYGVDASRDTPETARLIELGGRGSVAPLSHLKASRWLSDHGLVVSKKTLVRKLGPVEEIRAGRAFSDVSYGRGMAPVAPVPSTPKAPSRAGDKPLPAGLRGLVEDEEASAEPAQGKASRTKAKSKARPEVVDDGDLLERLLPQRSPRNSRGEVLFTIEELRALCATIYASAIDIAGAALSCGLNPFTVRRVLHDGMTALSSEKKTGEAEVAAAVLGHWAACSKRAGQAITISAARGDVRAQKLLMERIDQHAPDLDKIGGDARGEALGFARQIRALIHGELGDETGMINVQVGR